MLCQNMSNSACAEANYYLNKYRDALLKVAPVSVIRGWIDSWNNTLLTNRAGELDVKRGGDVCVLLGYDVTVRLHGFSANVEYSPYTLSLLQAVSDNKGTKLPINITLSQLSEIVPEAFKKEDLEHYLNEYVSYAEQILSDAVGVGRIPDEFDCGLSILMQLFQSQISAQQVKCLVNAYGLELDKGGAILDVPKSLDVLLGIVIGRQDLISDQVMHLVSRYLTYPTIEVLDMSNYPGLCCFILSNPSLITCALAERAAENVNIKLAQDRWPSQVELLLAANGDIETLRGLQTRLDRSIHSIKVD